MDLIDHWPSTNRKIGLVFTYKEFLCKTITGFRRV